MIAHSPFRMPLGDRGKHQHFGAGNDPARCEHRDQRGDNLGYASQGAGLFHSFLSPLAGFILFACEYLAALERQLRRRRGPFFLAKDNTDDALLA